MKTITFEELPQAISELISKVDSLENSLKSSEPIRADESEILSVQEAAEFLRLAKPTIYSLVNKRQIPFMKRSKRLYFSKEELIEYLREGRSKTISEVKHDANQYLAGRRKK